MAKLIAKTYGNALFELAREEGTEQQLLEEVNVLMRILKEHADFEKLMCHPEIPWEEKVQIMENVFHGRISESLLGFLVLVLTKERYRELFDIFSCFTELVKESRGIGVAYVTTGAALSRTQKERTRQRLLETTSFKEIEMHYSVDETLIGGMVIRIGDRVVDSSIKTKLENLTRQLYQIQL